VKAKLHADGGARGNPGPAGIGVVIFDENGEEIGEIARGIGHATNNVAEYTALIEGLKMASDLGTTDLEIFLDSELVVKQLSGEWKIKNDRLRQLAVVARRLMNSFDSASIEHVRREFNADADRLANQGMDAAALEEEDPGQTSFLQ
jgi:ribonuclease HI